MMTQQGTAIPSIQQASQAERIAIVCPSCAATLSVRRIYLGHQILCKQCSHTFLLRDSTKPEPMSADDSDDVGGMLQTGLHQPDINGRSRVTEFEYDQLWTEHDRHAAEHADKKLNDEQVDSIPPCHEGSRQNPRPPGNGRAGGCSKLSGATGIATRRGQPPERRKPGPTLGNLHTETPGRGIGTTGVGSHHAPRRLPPTRPTAQTTRRRTQCRPRGT